MRDSSQAAFRTAGRLDLRDALRASAMTPPEPVADVAVTVPQESVGGVLGDLAARRGRASGTSGRAGAAVVHAVVPPAELCGCTSALPGRTRAAARSPPAPPDTAPHAWLVISVPPFASTRSVAMAMRSTGVPVRSA